MFGTFSINIHERRDLNMAQKKALCIQDMSCIGRCSLTVVLPALSAMGLQACPLPTALLSSHPLGFTHVVHRKKTAFCNSVLSSFKNQGITFDAVLLGYLGSAEQTLLALEAIGQNKDALIVVDPVMADHGKLYKRSTNKMCNAIKKLCRNADVLTPNVTESAVLLGLDVKDEPLSESALTDRLLLLSGKYSGVKHIVITGARLQSGACVNAAITKSGNNIHTAFYEYEAVEQNYPGTGDLFAAVLTGGMLRHGNFENSIKAAAQFITDAAKKTFENGGQAKHGVQFEQLLHTLF